MRAACAIAFRAKRRIFKAPCAERKIERAEKRAFFRAADTVRRAERPHILHAHGGCDVHIVHRQAEERVAHHAAHDIERKARIGKEAGEGSKFVWDGNGCLHAFLLGIHGMCGASCAQSTAAASAWNAGPFSLGVPESAAARCMISRSTSTSC